MGEGGTYVILSKIKNYIFKVLLLILSTNPLNFQRQRPLFEKETQNASSVILDK